MARLRYAPRTSRVSSAAQTIRTMAIRRVYLMLTILVAAAFAASLLVGEVKGWNPTVILHIRLPRILLGLVVGSALATAGTVYQGLLRNPLADPYILGISSAGTFGALVAVILNFHPSLTLYVFSIGISFLSMLLVYRIATTHGRTPVQTLILAGVISSSFFSALVLLLFTLFRRESFSVLFFMLGSLATAGSGRLILVSAILVCAGFFLSVFFSPHL